MNPENIPYAAKVNAAAWLIRKARKIAMELPGTTREQRQAIELEIVDIGMRLYSETREQPQPETTHDPGEDHEREAYVAAVWELEPDAERWFIINDYNHRFTIEQSAERWRNHVNYSTNQDHELEAYIAAVRELVPDAERWFVANDYHHRFTVEQSAERWRNHVSYSKGQAEQ